MMREPHLRASDADRERVADLLREHCSAGRLSMEEFHTRLDACFAARTFGDLDQLLADLPGPGPYDDLPVPASQTAGAHPALPYHSPPSTELAPWRGPLASFVTTNIIVWVIYLVVAGGGFPWPVFVTAGTGAAFIGHAISGDWEDRRRRHRR